MHWSDYVNENQLFLVEIWDASSSVPGTNCIVTSCCYPLPSKNVICFVNISMLYFVVINVEKTVFNMFHKWKITETNLWGENNSFFCDTIFFFSEKEFDNYIRIEKKFIFTEDFYTINSLYKFIVQNDWFIRRCLYSLADRQPTNDKTLQWQEWMKHWKIIRRCLFLIIVWRKK